MTSLAAWGPTIVMALAILLAGAIAFQLTRQASRTRYKPRSQVGHSAKYLLAALREAESLNAYQPASPSDPRAYLDTITRLAPAKYQDGVIEIPRNFSEGRIVSVDLSQMSDSQAARLVDFCSGYLIGASGWLFRATDKVIVLTPSKGMTVTPLFSLTAQGMTNDIQRKRSS